MTTFFTETGRIVLKKLHLIPALGALGLKDGPRLPVPAVLSWAFHGYPPIILNLFAKGLKSFQNVIPAKAGIQ
jgi:hypothetical protein